MCGIWAFLSNRPNYKPEAVKKSVDTLVKRGPEGTRCITVGQDSIFAFTRLAINGLTDAGMQPFSAASSASSSSSRTIWMCNGEIYNARQLAESISFHGTSDSDCEVLGQLYSTLQNPVAFARALDGVFAIILYDGEKDEYVVTRDPYGVRPLFYSEDRSLGFTFGSERKSLEGFIEPYAKIYEFPPGEIWRIRGLSSMYPTTVLKEVYHTVPWLKSVYTNEYTVQQAIHASFIAAIDKRLMTERPIAALLSGGLDSSLVAALVQKRLKEKQLPPLKTFSIGMKGSSDLHYAAMVAKHIGSDHHEIVVTADEMFAVIPEVIRDIESYDITTVRASVGNWMIAREIAARTSCKVVFNGDGSDEVWGSYLYFYNAPNPYAFEAETQRLMREIHRYDVLRSDRSISSHGLEARTPFLDKQFVSVAMSIPTSLRMPVKGVQVEKNCLRNSFYSGGYLPEEVLWRRKEAFSDGVSSQEKPWFQEIQERIVSGKLIPKHWETLAQNLEAPVPKTPEAYYYRMLYESMYKKTGDYWPFWMPKWCPETQDPSAKTLKLY